MATGEGPVLNQRIEITAFHRQGHEFSVELSISPVRTPEGVLFNVFVRDITAHKQAEKALRESEARFRTLVEYTPEGLLVFNIDARYFVEANANSEQILDYTKEELLTKNWIEISLETQSDQRNSLASTHPPRLRATRQFLGIPIAEPSRNVAMMHRDWHTNHAHSLQPV